MLIPLLLAFSLFVQVADSKGGVIAGNVRPPQDLELSTPLRIVLLPSAYADLWNGEVQRRLDSYWERYRQAFIERKEFFLEVSRLAHRESLDYVVARMKRDNPATIADFDRQTDANGKFEFKNVTFGSYTVVAAGRIGDKEFIWVEQVDVNSSIPQYLALKTPLP